MKSEDKILVSLEELCEMLSCGRRYAERVGHQAEAEVRIGRLRRWNVEKIKKYLLYEAF